jgi:methanethiol S-methyltransferase
MTKLERLFVWAGGAAFVAALATTAWWFAAPLGRGGPHAGLSPLAALFVDAALFSVFAVHHSALARAPVKSVLARFVPDRLLRSVYVWAASLLLIALCLLWQPIGGVLYQSPAGLAVLLALAQIAGLALIVGSVRAIDPLELAGIRHYAEGPSSAPSLQITGPYRLVRHPLYLGWMMIVFGSATQTSDRLAFAAISSLYLVIAIPWEEHSLEATFGPAYSRYRSSVQWRVIPYVY